MITMIWTIIYFIELTTVERSKDLKVIATYKWSVPSQLPMPFGDYLNPASPAFLPELRDEKTGQPLYGPKDFMVWSFYGGSTDPNKTTPDTLLFFFVMDPDQIIPMMDDMHDLDPKLVEALKTKPQACLLGSDKLRQVNKRVGERFKMNSINYKGIDLEFDIVGVLPDGRYNASAIMRLDYFNQSFDKYKREHNGTAHPLANKSLNLIWIRVGDRDKFDKIGGIIEDANALRRLSGQDRNRFVAGRLVSRRLPRHLHGDEIFRGAGHPDRHGAHHGRRHQHHRARTALRNGGNESARLSAQSDHGVDPGGSAPDRRVGRAGGLGGDVRVLQSEMGRHPVPHRLLPGVPHSRSGNAVGPGDRHADLVLRQRLAGVDRALGAGVGSVFEGGVRKPDSRFRSRFPGAAMPTPQAAKRRIAIMRTFRNPFLNWLDPSIPVLATGFIVLASFVHSSRCCVCL